MRCQLHHVQACQQSVEGDCLPLRPGAPVSDHAAGDDRNDASAGAPARNRQSAKAAAAHFNEHQNPDQGRDIGQSDKDSAESDLRQAAVEQAAAEQAHGGKGDAGGKPGESADMLPPQQDHKQNKMCGKGDDPENLNKIEGEIRVHEVLTAACAHLLLGDGTRNEGFRGVVRPERFELPT